MKNLKILLIILATAVLSSSATYFFAGHTNNYSLVDKAYTMLKDNYYEEIDEQKAEIGMLYGLAASMGDPYTSYLSAEEYEYYDNILTGSYSGVGLSLSGNEEDDLVTVVSAFPNTPASEAGLSSGDKIITVDGTAVTSLKIDEAASKMKGKEGTEVKLTVLKAGQKTPVEITLKRRKIELETTSGKLINGNIAYIKINSFEGRTAEEFSSKFNALCNQGARKLIIDLRDNPGGLVHEATAIAECFLDKGNAIVYTEDKNGKQDWVYADNANANIPIVILENEGTASASEILIGALKDNKAATVVGEKSYGKGVIQKLFPLTPLKTSDGYLKITIARYFTPNGIDINHKGIEPDHKISGDEAQLNKAIELLK